MDMDGVWSDGKKIEYNLQPNTLDSTATPVVRWPLHRNKNRSVLAVVPGMILVGPYDLQKRQGKTKAF